MWGPSPSIPSQSETKALPWASILSLLPLEARGPDCWERPGGLTGLEGEPSGGAKGQHPQPQVPRAGASVLAVGS